MNLERMCEFEYSQQAEKIRINEPVYNEMYRIYGEMTLIVGDGAAFGQEMRKVMQ